MSLLVKYFVKNSKPLQKLQVSSLSQREKTRLVEIIILIYHQKLLNRFLDNLEEADKRLFLELLASQKSLETVEFLHSKIERIENLVELAILEVEQELIEDLEQLERL